ncbi:MAG: hypothetical protein L3K04_00160 [Thermoplasmata archaeon]|nr:hypothetical protein [Thermoplasmata archaeon]
MKFEDSLDELLASPSHVRVLRALFTHATSRLTGREVARRAGGSTAQVARVLTKLQDQGLARAETAGRSYLWGWNPDHIWAPALARLFEREGTLREELLVDLAELLEGLPANRALLYGSIPKRAERADSDVDLFIETDSPDASERVRERLAVGRELLWRKYGNPLSPLVLTTHEVRTGRGRGFLRSIERSALPVPTGAADGAHP